MYQADLLEKSKDTINQDSLGISKNDNSVNQDSPGILTDAATPNQIDREYVYLSPNEIIRYDGIADYLEPTTSTCPAVIRTPKTCYCIDGYDLVEKAIKEQRQSILCHVDNMPTESEIELALRKTAVRFVSDQGKPGYVELIRNCKKVLLMLSETTENPVRYSHGGARKGINYTTNNREDNIRILIAERLGKSLLTINKYLNYGEYLDETILETLVQSKESREFFEKVASNKRQFIKNQKCGLIDAPAISEAVSRKMGEWLEEYHEKGKIETLIFKPELQIEKKKCLIDPPSQFEHHREYENNQNEDSCEILYQEIQAILEALCAFMKEGDSDNREFTAIVKGEITEIARCLVKYDALMETIASTKGKATISQ